MKTFQEWLEANFSGEYGHQLNLTKMYHQLSPQERKYKEGDIITKIRTGKDYEVVGFDGFDQRGKPQYHLKELDSNQIYYGEGEEYMDKFYRRKDSPVA